MQQRRIQSYRVLHPLEIGQKVRDRFREYRITRSLGSAMSYEAQNFGSGIIAHFWTNEGTPQPLVETKEYFQITGLSEDNSLVTLKPWGEGNDNNTRTIKVRWDEDVKIIKDGLMKEDHQVFCTVGMVLGKEVMGEVQCLPKDPPIMQMPDLVMDMIFSPLSLQDRHNCRLVTPTWGFHLLPIPKVYKGSTLKIIVDQDNNNGRYELHTEELAFNLDTPPAVLQSMLDSYFFEYMGAIHLSIAWTEEDGGPNESPPSYFRVLEQCRKPSNLEVEDGRKPYNKELWEFMRNYTFLRQNNLMEINISLNSHLTKTQLLMTVSNLPKLKKGQFHVKHVHNEYSEDETDGTTILEILTTLPSLQEMFIMFGDMDEGIIGLGNRFGSVCANIVCLKEFLEKELEGRWIVQVKKYWGEESLSIKKE